MTIFEHAVVGMNGVLATGIQRRCGWQVVALAGVAAVLPDWDALTFFFGPQWFAEGHRLWGHNLLVAGLLAAIVSVAAYQSDAADKVHRWLARRWQVFVLPGVQTAPPAHSPIAMGVWILVGVMASYSHLFMDVAFNGSSGLPPWEVPLLWPFQDRAWAYPMVSWGNPGASVILAGSLFAMLRWPRRTQAIAAASLLGLAAFMVVCRGWS
jgi:membrane-bound metal-dependent hydrolase YbcI (DUF457 family)